MCFPPTTKMTASLRILRGFEVGVSKGRVLSEGRGGCFPHGNPAKNLRLSTSCHPLLPSNSAVLEPKSDRYRRLGWGTGVPQTRKFSTQKPADHERPEIVPDISCIGFIGLGNMGLPTALNLISAGYKVVAYDINEQAVNEVVVSGGQGAKNVAELAKQATMIFSMLPGIEQLRKAFVGSDGILENLPKKDTIIIEASTIGPVACREIAEATESHGHRMVDAPVSGGVAAATAGTLTFMVGAHEVDFKAIEPFLRRLGRTVVHCGGVTKGQAVKVCNNVILASTMMGVSEGYRLAEHLGVNMRLFNKVVNSSSGRCWSSELYNPVPGLTPNVPAARDYKGGFNTRLMAKDLAIAIRSAENVNTSLPVTKTVSKMYSDLEAKGLGDLDFSCVYMHNM